MEAKYIAKQARRQKRWGWLYPLLVYLGFLEIKEVPEGEAAASGQLSPPRLELDLQVSPTTYKGPDYTEPGPRCCICRRQLSYVQLHRYDRIGLPEGTSKPVCFDCIKMIKEA